MSQSSVQTDLKEAKQVMEDEGGANQTSQKQQQAKQTQSSEKQDKKADRKQSDPNENECGCGPV